MPLKFQTIIWFFASLSKFFFFIVLNKNKRLFFIKNWWRLFSLSEIYWVGNCKEMQKCSWWWKRFKKLFFNWPKTLTNIWLWSSVNISTDSNTTVVALHVSWIWLCVWNTTRLQIWIYRRQQQYRGVSAIPAAVSAVLSDRARFGTDAGWAAGDSCRFGGSSCCNTRPCAGWSIDAGPLLHFHPNCLQAECRRRWKVTQVLKKMNYITVSSWFKWVHCMNLKC